MCVCLYVRKDVNVGTSARELFDKHVNDLSSETCQKLVLKTMCKIDEMFRDLLRLKVNDGVRQAVSTANATVEKWGSKVRVFVRLLSRMYSTLLPEFNRLFCDP